MCDFHDPIIKTVALSCSQWFEEGQSAIARAIFGQIWLFDHERSPVELSDNHAILFRIQNYIPGHIFRTIGAYLRIFQIWVIGMQSRSAEKFKIIEYAASTAVEMCQSM